MKIYEKKYFRDEWIDRKMDECEIYAIMFTFA